MNHLIMGKYQHILLTICVSHGECHFIMVIFTEIRIQLHVFQEIVHPAHVPLQAEAQSLFLHISCNLGPGSRFLCDHNSSMVSSLHYCVQMLKEINGFQIFISTVLICNPFAILFAVIKIQHRCHRIYSQSIYMAFLYPVESIGDQEVLYLRAAVIIYLCPPFRMLSLSGILMLVHCSSVKVCQTMGIFWKMCRHPVKDNSDLIAMKIINHIFEILRCSITGGRSIISGHLISPGSVKGMLCNSHQLYMGISHLLHIVSKGRS